MNCAKPQVQTHEYPKLDLLPPPHSTPPRLTAASCLSKLLKSQSELFAPRSTYRDGGFEPLVRVSLGDGVESDPVADQRGHALQEACNRVESEASLCEVP